MPYPYNNTSNNMLAVYDYLHEKSIDEAKEVRMLQQMYKEK